MSQAEIEFHTAGFERRYVLMEASFDESLRRFCGVPNKK